MSILNGAFPLKVGEQEYKASKLTDRDIEDLDTYIKARYVANAQQASRLLGTEGKEIVQLAMAEVHSPGTNITWGTGEGANIMSTLEGTLHLGYQFILKRHPNVTYKQFEVEANKALASTLSSISDCWSYFYPPSNQDVGDDGGSSTAKDKSE